VVGVGVALQWLPPWALQLYGVTLELQIVRGLRLAQPLRWFGGGRGMVDYVGGARIEWVRLGGRSSGCHPGLCNCGGLHGAIR